MKHTTRLAAAVLIAAALPALGAGAAVASHGGDDGAGDDHGGGGGTRVVNTGTCSDATHWKIKAKPDDGGVEVEAEIDSDQAGQTWTWKLKRDGVLAAKGTSTTRGRSGSFSVERQIADGTAFRFRAVDQDSGEVCVATVTR